LTIQRITGEEVLFCFEQDAANSVMRVQLQVECAEGRCASIGEIRVL